MKLIKQVERIEVKKAFVLTRHLRKFGIATKDDEKIPSVKEYLSAHSKAIKAINKLSEKQIDKLILEKFRNVKSKRFNKNRSKRLDSYNKAHWYLATVSTKELGVWKKAGGLPLEWTKGSLDETAKYFKKALKINDGRIQERSRVAIPAIIALKNILKKDIYSTPIVFESGQGTNGRVRLSKTKFDIDDGNMRSIAYAVSGDKKIKVYIGIMGKK